MISLFGILCLLNGVLFVVLVLLWRFCRHLERGLEDVSGVATRAEQVIGRLQAGRERGADVAGLRRRVEAMERDIDEIEDRMNKLTPQLPPEIAKLNDDFKSRILVE